ETGSNFPGSDEVYVTIHVPGHAATRSKIFGDVDAGETNHFPLDQRCIFPIAGVNGPTMLEGFKGDTWTCAFGGAVVAGPFFSFTVLLHEKDPCGFPPCWGHGVSPGEEPPAIHLQDDLIGRRVVVYSMEELIALHVGQNLEESVRLSPPICPGGASVCPV